MEYNKGTFFFFFFFASPFNNQLRWLLKQAWLVGLFPEKTTWEVWVDHKPKCMLYGSYKVALPFGYTQPPVQFRRREIDKPGNPSKKWDEDEKWATLYEKELRETLIFRLKTKTKGSWNSLLILYGRQKKTLKTTEFQLNMICIPLGDKM